VPLAGNEGAVADGTQDFAERGTMFHAVVTDRVGVVTGEELGPGGVALGSVVELCEAETVPGQSVEIRSLNLPAIAPDIGIAHVVNHDEDDVWPRAGLSRSSDEEGKYGEV